MNLAERLLLVDRRIIFVLVFLGALIPILIPIGMGVDVSQPVEKVFARIEQLEAGDAIILSFDYGPSDGPELDPMASSILRHCYKKGIKVIAISLFPLGGVDMAIARLEQLRQETGAADGVEWNANSRRFKGAITRRNLVAGQRRATKQDLGAWSCEQALEGHGIYEMCKRLGAEAVNLTKSPWTSIPVGSDAPPRTCLHQSSASCRPPSNASGSVLHSSSRVTGCSLPESEPSTPESSATMPSSEMPSMLRIIWNAGPWKSSSPSYTTSSPQASSARSRISLRGCGTPRCGTSSAVHR